MVGFPSFCIGIQILSTTFRSTNEWICLFGMGLVMLGMVYLLLPGCKKQVFDQQFSEKLISADFGKLVLHIVIDKAVMRQRAAASLLGA